MEAWWEPPESSSRLQGETIAAVIGGEYVDLHNECALLDVAVTARPFPSLTLRFVRSRDAAGVELVFTGVSGLVFRQDDDLFGEPWDDHDVSMIEEIAFGWDHDAGAVRFRIPLIIGELAFSCRDGVRGAITPPATPR